MSEQDAEKQIREAARIARDNAERQRTSELRPLAQRGGVKFMSEDEARQWREREERKRHEHHVEELIQRAGVPERYRTASLEPEFVRPLPNDVCLSYARVVEKAIALRDRPGILALLGPRGVGKTWIACGLVLDFCRATPPRSARYLHAMDYFIGLKGTYAERSGTTEGRYETNHLRPALLVIDELHERGDTAWEDRMLTRLIVKRHEMRLATLLLSNDDLQQFSKRIGDSVMSRMKDDAGGAAICDWRSLRGSSI